MLSTEIFLKFLSWSEGRALSSVLAKNTGLSERTFRKKSLTLSRASLEKAKKYSLARIKNQLQDEGATSIQISDWLDNHPINTQNLSCYSTLVYESSQPESIIQYPLTLDFAKEIDSISWRMLEKYNENDINGFKDVLFGSAINAPIYFSKSFNESSEESRDEFLNVLRAAETWKDLEVPTRLLISNCLISFLALWDVEFGSLVYFKSLEPRSCFEMVLPSLNARDSDLLSLKKKRDILKYPIRRLIEILVVMGFSTRNKKVINKLPKRTRIFIDCGIAESDLTKWKCGINHFTKSDFTQMWTSLNSESNDPKAAFLEPWPLFIAATIFQNVFTDVHSEKGKTKTIWLVKEDYLPWWKYHFDKLNAKGTTFGKSPWPEVFNLI
jgi:hypothetical protein